MSMAALQPASEPKAYVVMGVSGRGESLVGDAIAKRLGVVFVEGRAMTDPQTLLEFREITKIFVGTRALSSEKTVPASLLSSRHSPASTSPMAGRCLSSPAAKAQRAPASRLHPSDIRSESREATSELLKLFTGGVHHHVFSAHQYL
jgi:hypothetical protein